MSLDIIEAEGMDPSRYVIVHADQIADLEKHHELARRGAWLEYDSIGSEATDRHLRLVVHMLDQGYADRLLLSQDAGWYSVGEPGGGAVRPYTGLLDDFVPRLASEGVTEQVIRRLLVDNPRRAFGIG